MNGAPFSERSFVFRFELLPENHIGVNRFDEPAVSAEFVPPGWFDRNLQQSSGFLGPEPGPARGHLPVTRLRGAEIRREVEQGEFRPLCLRYRPEVNRDRRLGEPRDRGRHGQGRSGFRQRDGPAHSAVEEPAVAAFDGDRTVAPGRHIPRFAVDDRIRRGIAEHAAAHVLRNQPHLVTAVIFPAGNIRS
ncbi:hypothetical protein SDC9_181036 [bioreactor metagenome]|uniref:Uncharacterized protein n=1 Tax=bioreactor metagenome TaxID=1076179 RepID=A0A645H3E5_9ZZZZ